MDAIGQSAARGAGISRAEFLKRIGLAAAGLATAGCTPLRIVLNDYDRRFDERAVTDRVLRAFVTAVIPGAPVDAPDLVRVYSDDAYPFAPYAAFFASDLCARARRLTGSRDFVGLDLESRTRVIQNGLEADAVTQRLYRGAVLLAQVSFYAGIYADDAGCPLIDFPGQGRLVARAEQTYADRARFWTEALTSDGNFA